jgi:hypothetical protein
MSFIKKTVKRLTASGAVTANPCYVFDIFIGTDGVNDPTVGVYNAANAADATKRILPSISYDASALGLNGFAGGAHAIDCTTSCYVDITCAGSCEIIVMYRDKSDMSMFSLR